MSKIERLLERCAGIEKVSETRKFSSGDPYIYTRFYKRGGEFAVPDDVFIEINATATNGTIGRLVDIDFGTLSLDQQVNEYEITYIIQVDGREGTNRIVKWHADILEHHDGTTKYVRNIKKHNKEEFPPHINKYNQHLVKDVWIAGLGPSKTLYFGQVTRWSKSSVWVNPTPSVPKSKENCITLTKETLVLPEGIDYEQMVTMMALSGGWS